MKEIEYFSTDQLLKELMKRFDDFAFIASHKRHISKSDDDIVLCFGGCYYSVIGLIELAKMAAIKGERGEGFPDGDSIS